MPAAEELHNSVTIKQEVSSSDDDSSSAASDCSYVQKLKNRDTQSDQRNKNLERSNVESVAESVVVRKDLEQLKSRYLYKHIKTFENYLQKHPNIILETNSKKSVLTQDDITSDDEIFIVQCPKSLEIKELLHTKIKLDGTTSISGPNSNVTYECHAEPFKRTKLLTMLCKRGESHDAISVEATGLMKINEKVNTIETILINEPSKTEVPYPKCLKIRHPLHGRGYEDRITIPDDVKSKLTAALTNIAIHHIATASKSDKVKNKQNLEDVQIKEDPSPVKAKKSKKKRQRSSADEKEIFKKDKKSKLIKVEIDSSDLGWISNI